MRVLHVIPTLAGGGAERFVASLAPRLCDSGLDCGVMTIYPSTVPFDRLTRGQVDVIDIERSGRYDPGFFGRMVSEMRSWGPDLVHTHMHNGKYWGRLAALFSGVRAIVHTVHNPCDPHRIFGEQFVDRLLNAASAAIVTFSQSQRRFLCDLERIPLDKVVVIPNGITHLAVPQKSAKEKARRLLGITPDEFVIFVVGTLYRPKNQRLALEALSAMPLQRCRIRLCVVGDGIDRNVLEQLASDLGVAEHVTFLGSRGDVREILPGADLLFVPSLTEGMPLAVLEAMSVGVPILSTPWIGASDLLEEGQLGMLARDWKPSTIAECFSRAMLERDRAKLVAMRAQSRARAEYDIAITARSYRRLYESLLRRREAA